MAQARCPRWLRKAAERTDWFVGLCNLSLAAVLRVSQPQVSGWPQWGRETVAWIQENAALLIIGTSALLIVAKVLVKLTRDPAQFGAVKKVVDVFRDLAFKNVDGDPRHYHRVTLFQHNGKHLVQYSRSGHATQNSKTKWLAPDNADKAQGIAGWVWSVNNVLSITDLPDVSSQVAPLRDVEEYAKKTHVSVQWVLQHRPRARSYLGIPVRVGGRPWGVILLDSCGKDTICQPDSNNEPYKMMARIITGVLWEA